MFPPRNTRRSRATRHAIALAVPVLFFASPVAAQAPVDTLFGGFYTSISARNPAQDSTVIVENGVIVGARKNPFDYEFAIGIDGGYGRILVKTEVQFERQNGVDYLNHEHALRYTPRRFETGVRLRDSEEDDLYVLSGYVEARFADFVGIGVTRQYTEAYFEGGATLARFSLGRERLRIWRLVCGLRAEYEVAPSQYRAFASVDIRNLGWRRYALVPLARYERIDPETGRARESYQAKLTFRIAF